MQHFTKVKLLCLVAFVGLWLHSLLCMSLVTHTESRLWISCALFIDCSVCVIIMLQRLAALMPSFTWALCACLCSLIAFKLVCGRWCCKLSHLKCLYFSVCTLSCCRRCVFLHLCMYFSAFPSCLSSAVTAGMAASWLFALRKDEMHTYVKK